MMIHLAAALFLLAGPALAVPPAEKEFDSLIAKTVIKTMGNTPEAAPAVCEEWRARLPEGSQKYLNAYFEACLGYAAAPAGPGVKPAACAHYQRAVQIWRETPPPKDEEDSRLRRARDMALWKEAAATHCPADPAAAKPAPIPDIPGGIVETQEGVSFELPAGWSVDSFDLAVGATNLKGPEGYKMLVARTNTSGSAYPEIEKLRDGRELQTSFNQELNVLFARIIMKDAGVRFALRRAAPDVMEKERAFTWVRAVASSVSVLGPRRCIGECPPGTVRPKKKTGAKK